MSVTNEMNCIVKLVVVAACCVPISHASNSTVVDSFRGLDNALKHFNASSTATVAVHPNIPCSTAQQKIFKKCSDAAGIPVKLHGAMPPHSHTLAWYSMCRLPGDNMESKCKCCGIQCLVPACGLLKSHGTCQGSAKLQKISIWVLVLPPLAIFLLCCCFISRRLFHWYSPQAKADMEPQRHMIGKRYTVRWSSPLAEGETEGDHVCLVSPGHPPLLYAR